MKDVARLPVLISFITIFLLNSFAVEIDPFYLNALDRGEQFFLAQDYSSAQKNFEIAAFGLMEDHVLLAKAYAYLGLTCFYLRNPQDGEKHLNEALELLEDQDLSVLDLVPSAQESVIRLLDRIRLSDSETEPDRSQEETRKDPEPEQAESRNETQVRTIIRQLKKELRKDPSRLMLYYELHDLYTEIDNKKNAIKILQDLIAIQSDEVKAHYLLGKISFNEKAYEDAESYFGRAFALSQTDEVNDQVLEIKAYLILSSYLKGDKERAKRHASGWEDRILQKLDDLAIDQEYKEKLGVIFKFI